MQANKCDKKKILNSIFNNENKFYWRSSKAKYPSIYDNISKK